MKILVTGANGFIGRGLCAELTRLGHQVVAAVRKPSAMPGERVTGDMAAFGEWAEVLRGVDVVLHLAGRAHVLKEQLSDPLAEFRRVNTDVTLALAQQAAQAGVKRFIFLSSIGVNGNVSHSTPFTAGMAPHPVAPYAVSKYEAELGLKALASRLEVVVVRPPLVYGQGAPGNFRSMVNIVARGLPLPLGAVTANRRTLVGLDNLISLLVVCLDHPQAPGQTFLAGDDEDLSTTALLRRLGAAMGVRPRLLPVPPAALGLAARLLGKGAVAQRLLGNLQVDISHTRDTLGWGPPVSVDEGLRRAVSDQARA